MLCGLWQSGMECKGAFDEDWSMFSAVFRSFAVLNKKLIEILGVLVSGGSIFLLSRHMYFHTFLGLNIISVDVIVLPT